MAVTLDYLVVVDAPPAAIITLNRPDQLNALSTGLMTELTNELERQAARPEVRAIVLKGAGLDAFWIELAALTAFAVVVLTLASVRLRRQWA